MLSFSKTIRISSTDLSSLEDVRSKHICSLFKRILSSFGYASLPLNNNSSELGVYIDGVNTLFSITVYLYELSKFVPPKNKLFYEVELSFVPTDIPVAST